MILLLQPSKYWDHRICCPSEHLFSEYFVGLSGVFMQQFHANLLEFLAAEHFIFALGPCSLEADVHAVNIGGYTCLHPHPTCSCFQRGE